jgi:hypothetical protein
MRAGAAATWLFSKLTMYSGSSDVLSNEVTSSSDITMTARTAMPTHTNELIW